MKSISKLIFLTQQASYLNDLNKAIILLEFSELLAFLSYGQCLVPRCPDKGGVSVCNFNGLYYKMYLMDDRTEYR